MTYLEFNQGDKRKKRFFGGLKIANYTNVLGRYIKIIKKVQIHVAKMENEVPPNWRDKIFPSRHILCFTTILSFNAHDTKNKRT